ncbi:MAG: autotransporter domain-containing protein, partial [Gallionellaceae bacterium]|nr:autotransporter domain-containing protein [Gallionellaceae bacterium]
PPPPPANTTGGVISGRSAIFLQSSATVDSINNDGTLTGMANNGIGIGTGSAVTGAIANTAGGIISGQENGIYLSSNSTIGSITNNGTITGTNGDGIKVWSSSNISGGITNNGTISGGVGIAIHIGSVVSSITNNLGGVIRGTGGVAIDMVGANTSVPMTINNSGLLDGAVTMENSILNLDGTSSSITGAVTGTSGSIVNVNGGFSTANTFSVDTFNINNGGTLNLAHNITAGTLNNAGTLVISETPQTVTGNYQQAATGVYKLGASNTTSYGQLAINGIANLPESAKINVNVSNGNSLASGDILTGVLTATTLNATTFNIHDNRLEWQFTGVVAGNSVNLQATSTGMTTLSNAAIASPYAGAGIVGVAKVLDSILDSTFFGTPVGGGMTSALDELTSLSSAAEVGLALQQFTPVLQGGAAQSTVDIVRNGPTHVVHEMMQDTIGLSSGDTVRSDSRGWIKPFGSRAEQDDRNGASGYTANSYGLVLGKDNKISEQWKVGAAVSYSTSRVGSTNGLQNIGIRTRQIDLYAADYLDELTTLHLQFVIGSNRSVSRRAVYGYVASSNYNSTHTLMSTELERRYQMNGKITLTPMVGVEYAHIKVNGYAETGASSLNLVVIAKAKMLWCFPQGARWHTN